MAEPHPKPLPNDGSDSPNMRKKTTAAGDSPPSKHSDESSATSDEETEDAATSKNPKNDPIEMEIDNIELMEAIIAYQKREGVSLRNSPGACGMFCYSYVRRGIGTGVKWLYKMYEMEIKFNSESAPTEDVEKKEFELWKKIWGDQPNDDDDPWVGSSSKKPKHEEIKLDDIEIMEAIVAYQKREGVYLANSIDNRVNFYQPYLERGIWNSRKWIMKLHALKTKFNSESAPIEDVEKKEFELWKKIWGEQPNDDGDPGVGSSQ